MRTLLNPFSRYERPGLGATKNATVAWPKASLILVLILMQCVLTSSIGRGAFTASSFGPRPISIYLYVSTRPRHGGIHTCDTLTRECQVGNTKTRFTHAEGHTSSPYSLPIQCLHTLPTCIHSFEVRHTDTRTVGGGFGDQDRRGLA